MYELSINVNKGVFFFQPMFIQGGGIAKNCITYLGLHSGGKDK